MRSIWNGAISFGLVSIAVKVYAATEQKHIRFHQLHEADGSRLRYRRLCVGCGEEVAYEDIAKGYDLGGGDMVMLTDDDFAGLPLASTHAIDVLEFVPADQIDPILYASAYFLEPDGAATKPYVLLREALLRTNQIAIVKVALRHREQLATLRVRANVLMLNTMLWPDEVREPTFSFLDADVETRPAELTMATSLITSMATDFHPKRYSDDYRVALQAVIEAKVAGREIVPVAEETAAPTAAADLISVLRASVERARAARAESRPSADAPPERATPSRPAHDPTGAATAPKRAKARAQPAPKKARTKKAPARKAKSDSKT
ncbi:Ku protein [Actinoplanes sp. NPDC051633]|uniref:non-homologous end joining protein Ku n=1 Tax=Actinoplanes sp. NPDC051633 TaxID=3155670 RepID=UPI003441F702